MMPKNKGCARLVTFFGTSRAFWDLACVHAMGHSLGQRPGPTDQDLQLRRGIYAVKVQDYIGYCKEVWQHRAQNLVWILVSGGQIHTK